MLTRLRTALLMALALAGCGVASVAPFVSGADTEFDSRLLGTWQDSNAKASVIISARAPGGYALLYTDEDGKVGRFQGFMGRIGPLRVLDVLPEDPPLEASDVYKSLLLPLHGVVVIDSIGSDLRFRIFEPDSLKRYLERQPNIIAHEMRDDAVVLTAPTAAVRAFVTAIARRPGALGDQAIWRRKSP